MKFISILLGIGALLLASVSMAEDLVLTKDVNSNSRALRIIARCATSSTEFLVASDDIRGLELWKGDGLQGTTQLVKDINPGFSDGIVISTCLALGNEVFFSADDAEHGTELWKSDGTAEGTVMVKDINPGSEGSIPFSLTLLGSSILFGADDGSSGAELWITDGTEAGTTLVKDINAGSTGSTPIHFAKLNDTAFLFTANDGVNGNELWKTDGTAAGTQLVKDIFPGAGNSSPSFITPLNGKVFFAASSPGVGREPWISDGTSGGTSMLLDIVPGAGDGFYQVSDFPGVANSKVLFVGHDLAAGYELFASDGTPGGTGLLKDVQPGAGSSFPNNFRELNGKVIFSASTLASGSELYQSDGSPGGTALLAELNPSSDGGVDLSNSAAVVAGSPLVFAGGVSGNSTHQAYATDAAAVTLLTDLFPGAAGPNMYVFSAATSAGVSFGLPAPVSSLPEPGLFLTDGTVSGTVPHPGTLSGYTDSSSVIPMAELNGKLIFAADDGSHGMELWSTDGTDAGTERVTDINPGPGSSVMPQAGFAVLNGKLLFAAADSDHGGELWVTDGTSAGTSLVKDIEPGAESSMSASSTVKRFYVVGNKVVFAAFTTASGNELWMSDGTPGGTALVSDIRAGSDSGIDSEHFAAAVSKTGLGPTLFFVADNGVIGTELWATTTAVTGYVADLEPGSGSSQPAFITPIPVAGDYLGVVFKACPSSTGCETFITTGGAPSVIEIEAGAAGSDPAFYTFVSENRMFFRARTAAEGIELWKSDFPFMTASLVRDVLPGSDDFILEQLTALNSTTVLFRGCGTAIGLDCELWKSDGSFAGTVRVKDLLPGEGSGYPEGFGVLDGVAYFLARDGTTSYSGSYFRSDGTEAGTTKLTSQGVRYYSTSYLPAAFTPALGTLFLGAYSSSYGYELFSIGEDQCPSDPLKSIPGLCGCGQADDDADGDGAVDCQEQCPQDSTKQLEGSCGCGVSDADGNLNGIPDCFDELTKVKPGKPKLKFKNKKKKQISVSMTPQFGVSYQVLYRYQPIGQKLEKKAKFKAKKSKTEIATLKAPTPGNTIFVKYRFLVPNTKIKSKLSKIAKKSLK